MNRRAQRIRRRARTKLQSLVESQGNVCHYCGKGIVAEQSIPLELRDGRAWPHVYFRTEQGEYLFALLATVEHKIPLSEGGTNADENLVAACQRCNERRRDPRNR